MPESLVIVGASGLAKDLAQLARSIDPQGERWPHIAYCSADAREYGRELLHGRVETTDAELLARARPADVVIAIGTPALRRRVAEVLQRNAALHFPNLVHPSVELDASKRIPMMSEALMIAKREHLFIPLHQQPMAWAIRSTVAETVQASDNKPRLWLTKMK